MTSSDPYWSDPLVVGAFAKRPINEFWESVIADQSARRVVDLGAGAGAVAVHAKTPETVVIAVDLSVEMLCAAEHRDLSLLVAADASELPFGSETIDAVYSSGLLHNIVGVEHVLMLVREISRIATDGAVVALEFFIAPQSGAIAETRIKRLGRHIYKADNDSPPMTLLPGDQAVEAIRSVGLMIQSHEHETWDLDVGSRTILRVRCARQARS